MNKREIEWHRKWDEVQQIGVLKIVNDKSHPLRPFVFKVRRQYHAAQVAIDKGNRTIAEHVESGTLLGWIINDDPLATSGHSLRSVAKILRAELERRLEVQGLLALDLLDTAVSKAARGVAHDYLEACS